MGETVLVDFFYAQQVGHAIEALHHAYALHVADPSREISVLLNAATPTELAGCCPFVACAYAADAPFADAAPDADASIAHVPRAWDWVLDDPRRHQPFQLELFAGMRDHYAAADRRFRARLGRHALGAEPPTRARHQPFRLQLPDTLRAQARAETARDTGPRIALMPSGSGPRSGYPSVASWGEILDALQSAVPELRVTLVGRIADDERSSSALSPAEHARLLDHAAVSGDCFDRPLLEQLAAVERCDLFLSPHTGFGMAALAVATPWLTLSGGRWFEWYFNHVPFRSVVPDTRRHACYSQFDAERPVPDGDGDERIPSMTRARIDEDLPRIVTAAQELIGGAVPYERCLSEYVADLVAAHGGDASALWSFDGVHFDALRAR